MRRSSFLITLATLLVVLAAPATMAVSARSDSKTATTHILGRGVYFLGKPLLYCQLSDKPVFINCDHMHEVPNNGGYKDDSYTISASDYSIAVYPSYTSHKPVFFKSLKPSSGVPIFPAGKPNEFAPLNPGFTGPIGNSHMTLTVAKFSGSGGLMLVVSYRDKHGNFAQNYEIGISHSYVAVYKIDKSGKKSTVYRHSTCAGMCSLFHAS